MTTEQDSNYTDLEKQTTIQLLTNMNTEDQKVALAVRKQLPQLEKLIDAVVIRMLDGGRLFYVGAGTSGRLGILDASECPPTFGVDHNSVIGIIAGGDGAIRKAVEFAEDDTAQAWKDLQKFNPGAQDTVIGIAASGKTPYVIGAVKDAAMHGLLTGCITCNHHSPLASEVHHPIEVEVGPEFLTGSTRMKAGTAQKMCLNMISTSVMIKLGRVKGNKMVDMQLSNHKLIDRAVRILMDELKWSREEATAALDKYDSVREIIESHK